MHVGPHPRRLNGTLGTSHSSAPFRNRSEAFDTAWPSQSLEQAKVPDAVLPGSPPSARPERSERRTHPCGSRNEATQSQLGLSANRSTDCLGVSDPNRQRRGSQDSRPSPPAGPGFRWSLLADFPGPHERQSLEHGSIPVRVGHAADPLVLVVMDQETPRIIGFGVHAGTVDGVALCRMFNRAIRWQLRMPKYLSTDNDPLYRFHQWLVNLRVLEVTEIKTVPYVSLSHPFVERLIGTLRRECLDRTLFWTTTDLEAKLLDFQHY